MSQQKSGGYDPATKQTVSLSQSGSSGALNSIDIDTFWTIPKSIEDNLQPQYSIDAPDAPHDPLEEALQRLDAAYTDAVNMAIAHSVFSRIMTEEEGRLLFEQQRQAWQEVAG